MKKIPHCTRCGQDGHYAISCHNKPIKPIKRTAIKKTTKPKLNRSKTKKELDKLVKDYVKERDNYTCQWCGKVVSGRSCQGSHVYSVGSCSVLQFEPLNIKVLCAYCHRRRWHSSPPDAMAWFKKKFPDRLAKLDEMRIANVKKTTYELQELVEHYKQLKHK